MINRNIVVFPLALSMALTLSACGGGGSSSGSGDSGDAGDGGSGGDAGTSYSIGGTISGNTDDVTLSLNGTDQQFSGAAFTFTSEVTDGDSYTVLLTNNPSGQSCAVSNGTGAATADVSNITVTCEDNQAQAGICRDHITTTDNIIGNNVYEFIASDGECFGRTDDTGVSKQEIPVTLVDSGNNQDMSMISAMTASARLTGTLVDAAVVQPAGGYFLGFAVDITNVSNETICGFNNDTAYLQNSTNADIAQIGDVQVLGDAYFGVRVRNLEYHGNCIPAGETRTMWGDQLIGHEALIAGQSTLTQDDFATLDHIVLAVNFQVADVRNDDYFLDALDPMEANWAADGNNHTLTLSFLNMTANNVYFKDDRIDVVYFDEAGYVIEVDRAEISDFLDVDEDDLTDSDYLLTAMGGMISLKGTMLDATLMAGRAAKAVVSLEICDQATSQSNCDAQF